MVVDLSGDGDVGQKHELLDKRVRLEELVLLCVEEKELARWEGYSPQMREMSLGRSPTRNTSAALSRDNVCHSQSQGM